MRYINDQIYMDVTQVAYRDNPTSEIPGRLNGWKIIEPPNAVLHDKGSGFDATVFHNSTTNQIIIGFRGTEPPNRNFWDKLADYETDVHDVILNRHKKLEELRIAQPELFDDKSNLYKSRIVGNPEHYIAYKSMIKDRYENNQFHQAQNLYEAVKQKHPSAEISATGHSLGGALAEYVGVRNNISSVSFNAPNIVNLLPDDLMEKVHRGDFEKTNIAYVHPGDTIGSGVKEPQRHVGATYYINSNYKEANSIYNKSKLIPAHKTTVNNTLTYLSSSSIGIIRYIPFTSPLLTWGPLQKLYNSIAGEEYHSYDHFLFDEKGNIANLLYTVDGLPVVDNPRINAYEESLANQAALKKATDTLLHHFGGELALFGLLAGGGHIQLRPEALKTASQHITRHVQEYLSRLPLAISSIQQLLNSSQSKSLRPIVETLVTDMQVFGRWYEQNAIGIAEFIRKKADDFMHADQG